MRQPPEVVGRSLGGGLVMGNKAAEQQRLKPAALVLLAARTTTAIFSLAFLCLDDDGYVIPFNR